MVEFPPVVLLYQVWPVAPGLQQPKVLACGGQWKQTGTTREIAGAGALGARLSNFSDRPCVGLLLCRVQWSYYSEELEVLGVSWASPYEGLFGGWF